MRILGQWEVVWKVRGSVFCYSQWSGMVVKRLEGVSCVDPRRWWLEKRIYGEVVVSGYNIPRGPTHETGARGGLPYPGCPLPSGPRLHPEGHPTGGDWETSIKAALVVCFGCCVTNYSKLRSLQIIVLLFLIVSVRREFGRPCWVFPLEIFHVVAST